MCKSYAEERNQLAHITVVKITSLCSHVLKQGMQYKCINAIISINLLQEYAYWRKKSYFAEGYTACGFNRSSYILQVPPVADALQLLQFLLLRGIFKIHLFKPCVSHRHMTFFEEITDRPKLAG